MEFGVHTSISGGIDKAVIRAAKLGCDTLQVFSSNPRGWKGRDISEEEAEKVKKNLCQYSLSPLVVHTPYLPNLASPKKDLYRKSIKALKEEFKRADKIGADYFVLHPGSHTGSGVKKGINRISEGLKEAISETNPEVLILLENVSGRGTSIGATIEELEEIYNKVNIENSLGICFDTCHGFAAGYDLRNEREVDKLLTKIDSTFGIDKLGVIHVNDSKNELASGKDRHEHIGEGKIGNEGFKNLLEHPLVKNKPFILETPKDSEDADSQNLAVLRKLQPEK